MLRILGKIAVLVLVVSALAASPAKGATIVDFASVLVPGDQGSSTYVHGSGLQATGLYFDTVSGLWKPANLYARNQSDDHGLGVCNPLEKPCPGPDGGGDVNELDNMGQDELIRLLLPAGFKWVSVQISSLDNNSSSSSGLFERGELWKSFNADPGLGFDSVLWSFDPSGGGEPSFLIPASASTSPYLFFRPYDWLNEGTNKNNDFLVYQVVIDRVKTPEPVSLGLLALGLVALSAVRRRT